MYSLHASDFSHPTGNGIPGPSPSPPPTVLGLGVETALIIVGCRRAGLST